MTKHRCRFAIVVLMVLSILVCSACATVNKDFSNVNFETSPYKHINNGGITEDDTLPYNIDAITGATLTVEGPAVVTSIPLSIRELENHNEGFCRGIYEDSTGRFIYEGMDLYYLLNDMVDGDNGIVLTDSAYKVVLKNSNRATIGEFTLEDVTKAHEDGNPILLAYGIGTVDEKQIAPFVFDAATEGEHSLGYNEQLDNEDGCIRLVYDLDQYGNNEGYDTFTNVAYVYLCEEEEPGFKHTGKSEDSYGASKYTDYLISFRGDALGYELNFTVEELENLVSYDENGEVVEGGIGYSDQYSLANTSYWYVNEYEGLDLYKLLQYLGMEDAETMGLEKARTTLVKFIAADGKESSETFSVDTLSYPDAFGFYNKNAADLGDGSYVPSNADLVDTGYPVLLAYGVNNYPYTINKTDAEYLSGLSNSGGPMRVVFGKTQYNHANGSNQVQYLSDVIVGEDVLYNTHKYTDVSAQNQLAQNQLSIVVNSEDGQTLMNSTLTVGDVEDIVYGQQVEENEKEQAHVKDSYEVKQGDTYATDCYEGVDLEYFFMNYLGLPGTNGTVTFSNGQDSLTITLEELFRSGYNAQLGREDMQALIAFAKNGSPLVPDETSVGYVDSIPLSPYLDSEPASYLVENSGGPLSVIIPSTDPQNSNARALSNVTSITVNLVPDAYAHIQPEYQSAAQDTLRLYGEGLEGEKTYTVEELESKQTQTKTLDFSVLDGQGNVEQQRYRGLSIYDLFMEVGIKNNAGDVIVYAADGTTTTLSLSQLKKEDYVNYLSPEKPELFAMLAYGKGLVDGDIMDGRPLVATEDQAGFDADYGNSGGPLKLIMPQENEQDANASLCVKNVVAIEVTANDIDTWSHKMSDIYEEFLDDEMTLVIKNDASEWSYTFTVEQLESLKEIIVRDEYSVLDIGTCEGVDIWKLIQMFAGDVEGIDDPISITAYAADGYKNDLLSVFYKQGFEEGVSDENGAKKKLIIAYAINGYPLVDTESHEGYTGMAGNAYGPLRVIAETNQGASVKQVNKLVVTLPGDGEINITVDESVFESDK